MSARMQHVIISAAVATMGIFHLTLGFAMIFTPQWFFDNIGYFPPFNRHYIGDLGAYQFPLGIALLWAARNPYRQRLLIGFVVVANLFHSLNHLYDDWIAGTLVSPQTLMLVISAAVFMSLLFVRSDSENVKGGAYPQKI